MIQDDLIKELRGMLPEYMSHKRILIGGRRNKPFRCINPGHPDKKPSMSYNRANDTLHCFGCGVTYDLFDVIALDYPDCDSFPRQVRKACEIFGREFPEWAGVKAPPAAPPPEEPEKPQNDYTDLVEREITAHGAGGSYFAARGISQALCERHRLYQTSERAVMPVYSDGRCSCYCARAIHEDIAPRYKNSPGAMEVFGGDYLSGEGRGGALFGTESVFDALAVEECGYQAIALCGAANVRRLLALCGANPSADHSYTFIAAGDADEAGTRMNARAGGLRSSGCAAASCAARGCQGYQ